MSEAITERCNCKFCLYSRKVDEIIASRDVDKLIATVRELMDANCSIGEDEEYYRLIVKGEFPGSVEVLTHALARAKAKESDKLFKTVVQHEP